ncbi:uncharacterized protein V6R79_004109 [Siganus canaliculatus]
MTVTGHSVLSEQAFDPTDPPVLQPDWQHDLSLDSVRVQRLANSAPALTKMAEVLTLCTQCRGIIECKKLFYLEEDGKHK